MMSIQSQYRHTLLLNSLDDEAQAQPLERVQFEKVAGAASHDEKWLQALIMRHPSLLPVDQIESAFGSVIPICTELPVASGFLDNLLVTPTGDLVLVECKLWRNPQARREVVGQIIEYASQIAMWSYDDLEKAIRHATPSAGVKGPSLYQAVASSAEIDEPSFCDAVARNLRRGRFLLLIVGDGIHQGVESMTDFLQQHGGLHFRLGLVELAIYKLPAGGFVVLPRVPAKTATIERSVVAYPESAAVKASPTPITAFMTGSGVRTTISQEQYLERLGELLPGVVAPLTAFVEQLPILGVSPEFGTSAMILRWRPDDGSSWNLGTIMGNGDVVLEWMAQQAISRGLWEQHKRYLEALAGVAGAVVKMTPKESGWYIVPDHQSKSAIKVDRLVADQTRRDGWMDAIKEFQKSVIALTPET